MNNEFSQDFYLGYFEAKAVFRAFFCEKIGVIPVMYSCLMLKGKMCIRDSVYSNRTELHPALFASRGFVLLPTSRLSAFASANVW